MGGGLGLVKKGIIIILNLKKIKEKEKEWSDGERGAMFTSNKLNWPLD